jgi:hypothetical protein
VSNSAKQAHDFYRDVINHRKVWTICEPRGFPRFVSPNGTTTQPFWSTITRVEKIFKLIPAYESYEIVEIPWDTFLEVWVPKCKEQKIHVGVNWSGKNLTGFDMSAEQLVEIIKQNTLTPHSSGTPNGAP